MAESSSCSKADQTAAKIWDRFAEGYSKQPIADEAAYQKKLEVTRQYLNPSMNLVEIGCGTGGTSLLHAPYVNQILATDVSAKMVEIAQQKAKEVSNVEFRQTSVSALNEELAKESQDMVLALSVLHLLSDKDEAIKQVHSWLKPGGYFVTTTFCGGDINWAIRLVIRIVFPVFQFFKVIPKIGMFSQDQLKESMIQSGFSIEYEWKPNERAGVFLIAKKTVPEPGNDSVEGNQ